MLWSSKIHFLSPGSPKTFKPKMHLALLQQYRSKMTKSEFKIGQSYDHQILRKYLYDMNIPERIQKFEMFD